MGSPQEAAPEPEAPVTEPPGERARDPETGQFVARSDEPTDQPEATEEPQGANQEPQSEWGDLQPLIDRYGSVQEALKALQHSQELIGRQGQELGHYRKMEQELQEMKQMLQQQVQADEQYVDPEYLDQIFEKNPAQALAEAIQAGHGPDTPIYERLMDDWLEIDPATASKADSRIRLKVMEYEFQNRLAQIQAPIQQQQLQDSWNKAFLSVSTRNPDMDTLTPKMTELAQQPFWRNAFNQARTTQDLEQTIETMALVARGSAIPSIQNAAVEAQHQAEEAARQERANAFVASASTANREPPTTVYDRQKESLVAAIQRELTHGSL